MTVSRAARRDIPSFALYGEAGPAEREAGMLHIEDIPSRSRKYLWRIATHRHIQASQCVFVTSGFVAVDLEESHREFEAPIVIIVPAGTVHGFGFRADSEGYVLSLDLHRLTEHMSGAHHARVAALFSRPRASTLRADPQLAARTSLLFGALWQEFRHPAGGESPVRAWLALATLWLLASKLVPEPDATVESPVPRELERVHRFRALIELHYLRHWPVARYAAQLAVSESSLNRCCLNLTGATAFDLIQQRLALEARRRLAYAQGPVAAIATQLGFKDAAYFCRFFRKHHAMSPTAYRRRPGDG